MPEDKTYKEIEEFKRELLRTENVIKSQVGMSSTLKWFRPPSGFLSNAMMPFLEQNKYKVALANVISNDAVIKLNPNYHTKYVEWYTKSGSIILLHCIDNATAREANIEIFRHILPELKRQGYTFKTLSEMYYSE